MKLLNVVTAQYAKYGGKYFFIFDSDAWKDRVFISDPEKALSFLNKLTKRKNAFIDCKIDLVKLNEMILQNKLNSIKL